MLKQMLVKPQNASNVPYSENNELTCRYGTVLKKGVLACKKHNDISTSILFGILMIVLVVSITGLLFRIIQTIKYQRSVDRYSFNEIMSNFFNNSTHYSPHNNDQTDERDQYSMVPKYTFDADPEYDIGFYDSCGNLIEVPIVKPEPTHTRDAVRNQTLNRNATISSGPPTYQSFDSTLATPSISPISTPLLLPSQSKNPPDYSL